MEQHMEQALRDGEFLHVIQPKYALDGSQILGGEALLRWQRMGHGFTSPGEFIPLFERNGFIRKLTRMFLYPSARPFRNGSRKEKQLFRFLLMYPVSIYIRRILLIPILRSRINIIDTDGIIELELTENILLKNTREIFTILEKLRSHGFCCSIDDFGSGYSSLNELKDLPWM